MNDYDVLFLCTEENLPALIGKKNSNIMVTYFICSLMVDINSS